MGGTAISNPFLSILYSLSKTNEHCLSDTAGRAASLAMALDSELHQAAGDFHGVADVVAVDVCQSVAGHTVEGGISGILNKTRAAGLFDGLQPANSVPQHSGKNHPHGIRSRALGDGKEDVVDSLEATQTLGIEPHAEPTTPNREEIFGRGDVQVGTSQRISFHRFLNVQPSMLLQQRRELVGCLRVAMHGDHQGRLKCFRQQVNDFDNRFQPPGRSAYPDQQVGEFRKELGIHGRSAGALGSGTLRVASTEAVERLGKLGRLEGFNQVGIEARLLHGPAILFAAVAGQRDQEDLVR